jgi:general secretion pathway protein D
MLNRSKSALLKAIIGLMLLLPFGCAALSPADKPEPRPADPGPVLEEENKVRFAPVEKPPETAPPPAPPDETEAPLAPAAAPSAPRPTTESTPPVAADRPSPTEVALAGDLINSIDFQEERLSNVLKVVSSIMGVNVVAQKDIAEDEITIYLRNVTPLGALEALCKQNGYWYEEGDGFIRLGKVENFGRVVVNPDGTIRRLMFRGMPLAQALGVISERTGQNLVCRANIGERPVQLMLSNVSVQAAVEIICKELNLWYRKDAENNYTVLMSTEDYGKNLEIDYRPQTRVFNLKHTSAPQLAELIALTMGRRVRYTPPNMVRSYEHLKTPDFEDDDADIEAAKTDEDLSKDIEAPEFEDGTLTPEKIQDLLSTRLDLMLRAEDLRRINQKIGFALVAVFMRNNAVIASSTDTGLLDEIGSLVAAMDTPTPQVLVETKILRVNLTDDFTSFFDLSVQKEGSDYTFDWSSAFPDSTSYAGLAYSLVKPDQGWAVDATIKLLKDDGCLNAISSPMVVTAQNSEAKTFVGTIDFPLVTNITAESVVNDEGTVIQVLLNPVVETRDIGVTLRITPQINEDRSVTLRLFIEESEISEDGAVIPYYDGKAEELRDYAVDVVQEETINTIINVPAGHILVLGGLVDEQDSVSEKKVPFLGDLPLVGFFFKKTEIRKNRTERIFLLKPYIMMSAEESGATSLDALEGNEHPYIRDRQPRLFEYEKETKQLIRE